MDGFRRAPAIDLDGPSVDHLLHPLHVLDYRWNESLRANAVLVGHQQHKAKAGGRLSKGGAATYTKKVPCDDLARRYGLSLAHVRRTQGVVPASVATQIVALALALCKGPTRLPSFIPSARLNSVAT